MRPQRLALGFAGLALVGGCSGESFVEGELRLGDLPPSASGYEFAEVRAFPEHPEGFSVRRIYEGQEVLEQSFLLGNNAVPASFRLEGYDVGEPGGSWRIIAWLTNREDSEWVGTGEPYGTREFTFDCSNGPVCAIRGIDVTVNELAPDN